MIYADGDIYVTWSILENLKHRSIVHLQGEDGKTLCGITIGMYWGFDRSNPNIRGEACHTINCARCLKQQKRASR